MNQSLLAIGIGMFILTGCSEPTTKTAEPKTFSASNTELNEWGENYNLRQRENAHSGSMVAILDSTLEFSYGYSKILSDISKTPLDSVVISYWVFLKNGNADAKTVLSIDTPDGSQNMYWQGNAIGDKIKEYNKWMQVKETYALPPNLDRKNKMKIYIWSKTKEEILLDDFVVNFY